MFSPALHGEETEASTTTVRKRIRARFRGTLAGLLELEVLRVRHKGMVETALERTEANITSTNLQRHYWVDKDLFRLKLKRSFSEEDIQEVGTSRGLSTSRSSEDLVLHQRLTERSWNLHSPLERRASSGFCDSDFGDIFTSSDCDTISSLSTSLASLKYKNSVEEGDGFLPEEMQKHQPVVLQENRGDQSLFSDEAIPEDGFRSVVDLYPDSHWPHLSDVLQPKVVLQPTYRSDLPGRQGTEVYRYPSPLHAVALQSPLYAPNSPQNNRKNCEKHFSGSSLGFVHPWKLSEHSSCHAESNYLSSKLLRKHSGTLNRNVQLEMHSCEEIILKRARVQYRSPRGEGMSTRPKRGMYRTSSLHKNRSFCSLQASNPQRNKDDADVSTASTLPAMRSYLNI